MPKWISYGRVCPVSGWAYNHERGKACPMMIKWSLDDKPFYSTMGLGYLQVEYHDHIYRIYNPNQYKLDIQQVEGQVILMTREKPIQSIIVKGKK